MRVLAATRLTQKLDGKTGLETQDAEMIKWAEREGHTIVFVAADFEKGTSDPWDRKNLRPWVTEADKLAQYDAVVAYRLDRLSRGNNASTARIEKWADEHGKRLLTEDGLAFPCEGAEGIRWDVTKRIAHEEWLKTSERYKRMNRFLRDSGYHVGRAPYGYRSVPDGKHKTLVIDPVEADVIRDAITWYLDGMSLDEICVRLNDAGRRPRRMKSGHEPKWAASTLSRVLHNEIIVGRQKSLTGQTILKVEPILSREIWDKAMARMAARSSRKGVSGAVAPALLTSIIVCTDCDKPMYRTGRWGGGIGYYCRVKGCRSYVALDVADGEVHSQMSANRQRDIIETLIPGSGHDAAIAEVKRDLSEAVEAEKFERLAALREELARLRALPASPPVVERRESALTVAEMWAGMQDDKERRAYLIERCARITYGRDEDGRAFLVTNIGQAQTA